jgi:protein SCO1/2
MARLPMTSPPRRSPYRFIIWLLGLLIVGVLAIRYFNSASISPRQALPKFTIVPPFALMERSGRTITNSDLLGKIWVADFIYTTCPGPCPLVTAGMARVQAAVRHDPQVQLVTFTVDPQNDTAPVLAAYADKFGADPNRWWFLTGPEKPLYNLIQNGFYQVVQDNRGQPPQDGQFTVTHSTKLVLVDADGVVRAFYDGVGADGRADLLKGIQTLEKEEKL